MTDIIVTGGRDYSDWNTLQDVFDILEPFRIIQGGASGADRMAKEYGEFNNIPVVQVDADWNTHGKAAGPIRNREMLERYPAAIVIAFPGGKGTENCVKTAVGMNRIVLRVEK